jgi:hypothetical protein
MDGENNCCQDTQTTDTDGAKEPVITYLQHFRYAFLTKVRPNLEIAQAHFL